MKVPTFGVGNQIRRGAIPNNPSLIDIAPTISALLGTRPPEDAQGKSTSESLKLHHYNKKLNNK